MGRSGRTRLCAGLATVALAVAGALGPAGAAKNPPPAGGPASTAAQRDSERHLPPASPPGQSWAPAEMLVRFDPSVPESQREQVRREHRLEKIEELPIDGLERVRIKTKGRVPEHASQVGKERTVRYAQPNFEWSVDAVPDDPAFGDLWGFDNRGQFGSGTTSDADGDVLEGWDLAADTSGVVVGVIDEGIDITHADLAANIWVNSDEMPGNGKDDDANGFIDDVNGWDFHNNDASVYDGVDDDHGTHVAGTIAAVTGNGVGVAGVSDARIMPLKFLPGTGSGLTSNAVKAIHYAIDNGADILNNSWGGTATDPALQEAIQDAYDAGLLFVASAGNSSKDTEATAHYPSSFKHPNVVSVAATDWNDALASFSNYGAISVDVGAPGDSIQSTVPGRNAKAVRNTYGLGSVAFHTFGFEGVRDDADRDAVMAAALSSVGASPGSVYIVDDDHNFNFHAEYGDALPAAYTAVYSAPVPPPSGSTCFDGPSLSTLEGYDVVVWVAGTNISCSLTANDRAALESYVNGGGKLLLFGESVAQDLATNGGDSGAAFLADVLGADYVASADDDFGLVGTSGTDYAGIDLQLLGGSSVERQVQADAIAAQPTAVATMMGTGPLAMYSGTSMASPFVTGVLVHLMAKYADARPEHLKQLLMDLGDPVSALAGKTVSGKRVNLANILTTRTLTGTVSIDGGGALAGACVTARTAPDGLWFASTRTDGAGAYRLDLPPDDYRIEFRDCAGGTYATEWHGGVTDWASGTTVPLTLGASTATTVNASLATGGSASGTVTTDGANPQPLAGICVDGFTPAGTHVGRDVTDGAGNWEIYGFGAGQHTIRYRDCTRTDATQRTTLWHAGSTTNGGGTPVSVGAGASTTGLSAQLPVSGGISGTVTASAGGAALGDICVSAYTSDGYFIQQVRTDGSGSYTVRGMGTDSYKLQFRDCSGRDYPTKWSGGVTDYANATGVPVTAGSVTPNFNMAL